MSAIDAQGLKDALRRAEVQREDKKRGGSGRLEEQKCKEKIRREGEVWWGGGAELGVSRCQVRHLLLHLSSTMAEECSRST